MTHDEFREAMTKALVAEGGTFIATEPDDLMAEIEAAKWQHEHAKKNGLFTQSPPNKLTFEILGHIFNLNWREREIMYKEIQLASRNVE